MLIEVPLICLLQGAEAKSSIAGRGKDSNVQMPVSGALTHDGCTCRSGGLPE